MGAGKFPAELVQYFRGAEIVILPDNDPAGRKHAALVATRLHGAATMIRVLDLPGLGPKQDVVEWLAAGGVADQLIALGEGALNMCGSFWAIHGLHPQPRPTSAAPRRPPRRKRMAGRRVRQSRRHGEISRSPLRTCATKNFQLLGSWSPA
jgi:hypothetical protein